MQHKTKVTPEERRIFYAREKMLPGKLLPGGGMVDDMKETLKDHERRIVALEKTDAEFAVRIENLCKKLEELTSWMKALVVALVSATGGFFVWYVQQIGR